MTPLLRPQAFSVLLWQAYVISMVGKTRYRGLPMVHMCRETCQGRDAFHPPPQCWEGWSAAWGAELPIFPLLCETARSRAPSISSNGRSWWLIALVGNPNGTGRVTGRA